MRSDQPSSSSHRRSPLGADTDVDAGVARNVVSDSSHWRGRSPPCMERVGSPLGRHGSAFVASGVDIGRLERRESGHSGLSQTATPWRGCGRARRRAVCCILLTTPSKPPSTFRPSATACGAGRRARAGSRQPYGANWRGVSALGGLETILWQG